MAGIQFSFTRQGEPLTGLAEKHYAPALVHAINNTIERVQAETRKKIPTQLRLRTAQSQRLLHNLVYIGKKDFASTAQRRFTGRVALSAGDASEGVRRFAPRLVRFQFGGVEHGDDRPLYVPTSKLRATPAATIRRDLYPKALGVLESRQIEGGEAPRGRGKSRKVGLHRTATGKVQVKGKRRTFAIDPRFAPGARSYGVWQRSGRSFRPGEDIRRFAARGGGTAKETAKLWNYVRQVRYPKRFTFTEDGQRIVAEHFVPTLKRDLDRRVFKALGVGGRR